MRTSEPREGQRCMWGDIQCVEKLANGIWTVSTASHGGIKLDRQHNARVPKHMRMPGGWYEEDCAWSIPFVLFRNKLQHLSNYDYIEARKCFRMWFPDQYEKWSGNTILPGVSYIKDQRVFREEHAQDWIVISAVNADNNTISVTATLGGNYDCGIEQRQFIIPTEEYKDRGRFGFIIDTNKHQEKISA